MQKKNQNPLTDLLSLAAAFSELTKKFRIHPQFFQPQMSFYLNDLEFRGLAEDFEKII